MRYLDMESKVRKTLKPRLREAVQPLKPKTVPGKPAAGNDPAAAGVKPVQQNIDPKTGLVKISPNLTGRFETFEHVLDNMIYHHGTSIMLKGTTGIGKTTLVKQLAKLLGLSLIVIEAPHITEEEVINIPFIVFSPLRNTGTAYTDSLSVKEWNVELSQSHLAYQLQEAVRLTDQQYMATVSKFDSNTMALYQAFDGDVGHIPPMIQKIRQKFRVILFIDEFMRQTGHAVRNIMRGILDRKIGNDNMPAGVYTIYASNFSDVGQTVEPLNMNMDFKHIEYKPPTKDEFFHYLIGRFESDQNVKLNPVVINSFYNALSDEHLSFDDLEKEIRTSPRRWEDLLLYINANIPVQSKDDAAALIANIKSNFSSEKDVSSLYEFVVDIVNDIIAKTGGAAFKDTKPLSSGDWRSILRNQIKTKIKLGDARKYVPVVMGNPGIGKTSEMAHICDEMNLRLISINCSTLSSDEITGIPVPKTKKANSPGITTDFAEPALYKKLVSDMDNVTQAFMRDPKVSAEKKKQFQQQRYKYVVFFDELNRVNNSRVFNSLRRVILEKSFNDDVKLPNDVIVVAAMNPNDRGTSELTGHLKDAIDLIDAQPSWSKLLKYLDNRINSPEDEPLKDYSAQAKFMARKIVTEFGETFNRKTTVKRDDRPSKMSSDELPFNLKVEDLELYISPREYTTMFGDIVQGLERLMNRKTPATENDFYRLIVQKIDHTIDGILTKHETESPQFKLAIASWVKSRVPEFMVKKRTSVGLEGMLDLTLEDNTKHLKDDPDFVNYARNFDTNRFNEEMTLYFEKLFEKEKTFYDALLKQKHSKKAFEQGKIQILDDTVDDVSYIVNEIRMAVKAHDLSNEVVDGLETALVNSLTKVLEDEISDDLFNQLHSKILDIFGAK